MKEWILLPVALSAITWGRRFVRIRRIIRRTRDRHRGGYSAVLPISAISTIGRSRPTSDVDLAMAAFMHSLPSVDIFLKDISAFTLTSAR
jgi:hypothetical protein